jgi:hypothetical protein
VTKSNSNRSSSFICKASEPELPSVPTIAGMVPVTSIMTRDVMCVRADLEVEKSSISSSTTTSAACRSSTRTAVR